MLTSYHAHTARILDGYCDVILVGDSLGMVMHGLETTIPVTVEMMILQGRAVMRGSNHALVIVDLPFGSYETSKEQAFTTAARVLKETGCGAIKLEGGQRMAETIRFLVERGVPVMAHVGLTPAIGQRARRLSRSGPRSRRLGADRSRCTRSGRSRRFRRGARGGGRAARRPDYPRHCDPHHRHWRSPACDGQVLVLEDMLGLSPWAPKFVKRYAALGPSIEQAVASYAAEVRRRAFPGPDHVYALREKA